MTDQFQPPQTAPIKPELMSPAGYWPELQAAIEAGADAVYFGLNHFSARAKVGFDLDELPEVMETLHARGVKGYVTFNTLVFDHELELAEQAIAAMAAAGVDAVIVQDVGAAKLVRAVAPELELHGSTQMSITSAQGAQFAVELGCTRVVLGRELSLQDIRKIAGKTDAELEVFVHGALCVSYSGQCFSSEAWGGRSANRGKCAQACRLSYDLIVDGQPRDLGPYRYLLSPGDLCAIEQIPDLADIGVACVKIEGRYKDANYVALTTRAYREAIDRIFDQSTADPIEKQDLEQIYSRGLGPHFISGTNHQTVVEGRAPRHRGLNVGQVVQVKRNSVVVESALSIRPGDGLVFDAADWRSPDEPEEGGNVYQVEPLPTLTTVKVTDPEASPTETGLVELKFGHGELQFERIRAGDRVWRTNDPQLVKSLKPWTRNEVPVFTRPIFFAVSAAEGQSLQVTATLESGLQATFKSEQKLGPAQKRPLDLETLQQKLGRLGGTPFHLGGIEFECQDPVFVPTSMLNQLRRQLVDELFDAAGQIQPIATKPGLVKIRPESRPAAGSLPEGGQPKLHLLVRTPEQLEGVLQAAAESEIASVTLDYLELYGLRPSVEKIQAAGLRARVASPRILKPSEQNVVRFLTSLNCDIVIRSSGLLLDLQQLDRNEGIEWIGDFSLNVANAITATHFLDQGLDRISPTYDLNAQQIEELTNWLEPDTIETICFSHLPVFHTEHCLFCRFLSEGTDHTNCGHPCEKHRISVRDSQGRAHPVMADVGCRNTVFGAEAQTKVSAIEGWQRAGLTHFRVELVHQTAEQTTAIANAFHQFFEGRLSSKEIQQQLDHQLDQGTTEGSLFVPPGYKQLVQLEGP